MKKFRSMILLSSICVTAAFSQITFRGDQILKSTERTVDIFSNFMNILVTQNRYNAAPSYFGFNLRTAPGDYLLEDGSKIPGNLSRMQLSMGSSFGDRLDEGTFFFGLTADNVTATNTNDPFKQHDKLARTSMFQAILYAGVSSGEMQLVYGYIDKGSLTGLNVRNEFQTSSSVAGGELDLSSGHMITLYHNSGLFLSMAASKANSYDALLQEWKKPEDVLEIRFQIQPLKKWLPDFYGLPFLAIDKLSDKKTYYGQFAKNVSILPQNAVDSTAKGDPYEVSLGSDDMKWFSFLEDLRIRAVAKGEVYPRRLLRMVEVGGNWQFGEYVRAGARTQIYKGTAWNSSLDMFVMAGIQGSVQLAFSYSFNSPDGTTYLPLRGASVWGMQVIYGVAEMITPLIPLIKSLDADSDNSYYHNDDDDE